MSLGLFEDYEQYLTKYQKIYGDKTVVLYQNGMFFETYGIDNDREKFGLVKEVSDMLNIQLTRRNKAIVTNDRKNFLLAGFPVAQLDRYLAILTEENGYVVIVVEQVTPAPNVTRDVTYIVSPGTNIKYICHPNGNYLASIYIEHEGQKVNQFKPIDLVTVGLSVVDVSTGQNVVYEVSNMVDDQNHAFDETYRFLQTFQPREIVINTRQLDMKQEELVAYFDIGQCLIHCHQNAIPNDFYKTSFQNEFLGKIFKNVGMLKPIEFVNLEKYPTSIISYILLLDFCYKQKETLIDQIECPRIWNNKNHMILDNNCINQLNLISSNNQKHSSIFNLIDQTSTAMGKRLLKEKLLLPLLNHQLIEERYNYTEFFRQEFENPQLNIKRLDGHQKCYKFQIYEPHLKVISDIERLHRKICLKILQPCEFSSLNTSYREIITLLTLIENENSSLLNNLFTSDLKKNLIQLVEYYSNILDLNESVKYNTSNISGSFFRRGYNQSLDSIQDQITEYMSYFQQLATQMSSFITKPTASKKTDTGTTEKSVVTYEHTEGLGYHLEITTARFKTFSSKCLQPMTVETKLNKYSVDKSTMEIINNRAGKTCKITSTEMKNISQLWENARDLLLVKVIDVYREFLAQIYDSYNHVMAQTVSFISNLDMYKSNAKTSLLYNYCRPVFETDISLDRSSLKAIQLRHPLIEQIQNKCQYVPQDVTFNKHQTGILLFGVNAVGKCYDPETPILMFDGEIKRCIDIKFGDQLMGDDSTPRNVLSTTQGMGQMYDICPSEGDIIRVNGPHILTLLHGGYKDINISSDKNNGQHIHKYTITWIDGEHQVQDKSFSYTEKNYSYIYGLAQEFLDNLPDYSGQIIEISVDDYLKNPNPLWKSNYYLYNTGVEFGKQQVDLDPYIIGYWIGNSTLYDSDITMTDHKFFMRVLHKYNLINNKHIPKEYLINSRQNRLKLFAGLIDSDCSCSKGDGLDFVFGSKILANDLCYLARSLGYMTTISEGHETITNMNKNSGCWRIYVDGNDFTDIPLLLEYKRPSIKHNRNLLTRSFQIKPTGLGNYCGFLLDSNQRHVLGDFTVGHNSSLMKAIGIATIMAQAGFYVPAKEFIYTPYQCVLTRIVGNDNLFKGQSSFAVEMGELRGILKRASQYSLVLGDEICHGTETISAVSLVASAIITLSKLESNFLFATHLHQLSQMEHITELDNVKMYHLKVRFDEQDGKLIYDRQLGQGPGNPIYGLEVAKAMDLDRNFIDLANEIRREIMDINAFIPIRKSKYNKEVYLDQCGIPGCTNRATATHHINFQSHANDMGFIDHLQKNHVSNLLPLCKDCHTMLHDDQPGHWKYIIRSYIMTSDGLKLDYDKIQNPSRISENNQPRKILLKLKSIK